MSPDSPVTYREFHEFMARVDARAEKLDKEKADVKDVDVLANMVRELSAEVAGLRKVLIGFMVAITLAALGYAFTTYRLAATTPTQKTAETR